MTYYAHSIQNEPPNKWQLLETHLNQTAKLASKFAKHFNSSKWAYTAGLWHDLGKYSDDFQKMLHETAKRHIDHSTAGAQYAVKKYGTQYGKILAYIISGHHTGIPDGKSTSSSCLVRRLSKTIPEYRPDNPDILKKNDLGKFPFLKSLDIKNTPHEKLGFKLSFFIRMLYSCLVDADFLDTEHFLNPEKSELRPKSQLSIDFLNILGKYIFRLSADSEKTEINKKRYEIFKYCSESAELKPGFFSLTVPTGGGKTLSSLYFAVKHALKFGMERIIYVIPYTSIIEQNAEIFRNIFGEKYVLEHHSSFNFDENEKVKLAAENWDIPITVTTNVQFFESLFSNRSSKARKLHNTADSVVILDEAQMLPVPLLYPTLEALKELAETYNTTVLFCTATQPALLYREDFIRGLTNVKEIIPEPENLSLTFRRTQLHFIGKASDEEIADRMTEYNKALCIVNTRRHAHRLYELIKDNENSFHLSALMCPAHRRETLKNINSILHNNKICRVISTQVIEAGVDIDFPIVMRAMAGIDSIIQAAGRCNREGKLNIGEVFVFETENKIPPGLMRQGAEITREIKRNLKDIYSLEAINTFFRKLYWLKNDKLDEYHILDELKDTVSLNFPFKEIAEKYKIIKNNAEGIIIPYNDNAREIIEKLRYSNNTRGLVRKAQQYIVQVPEFQLGKMEAAGAVERINGLYPVLINESLYNKKTGLWSDEPEFHEIEELIV
ncbi:MAG: CRISPR-associated helicase Cas3' [Spirochaetales bacterium]|nr:CRISPR-associated helicase Cas3' [Spirochaetales bacterium]